MGEQHPAEKKVVLEFATADMPNLEPLQREKLKKLAGVRYNPETDIIKMSCEMYETQAQNKRYLGDLVDSLLREARVNNIPYYPNSFTKLSRILPIPLRTCP
jgi:small subunit ribosomal protein S35